METLEPDRGVSIALTAIPSSGEAKQIGQMNGDIAALNEIAKPPFAEIVSTLITWPRGTPGANGKHDLAGRWCYVTSLQIGPGTFVVKIES